MRRISILTLVVAQAVQIFFIAPEPLCFRCSSVTARSSPFERRVFFSFHHRERRSPPSTPRRGRLPPFCRARLVICARAFVCLQCGGEHWLKSSATPSRDFRLKPRIMRTASLGSLL